MKVCVDPGHGMSNRQKGVFDPGATHLEDGFLFKEADIALRYGLSLKDVFRELGVSVFMTRDDDGDHAHVGSRAKMAMDAGCDAFISIHLNDFDDDKANGLEVLYRGENGALAKQLHDALVKITQLRPRGISLRGDLAVLNFDGPAVLVELGFIANDVDRNVLLNAQKRDEINRAIAGIVIDFLNQNPQ